MRAAILGLSLISFGCSSAKPCVKACPNDPDLTQTQTDQCMADRASKCSSTCGSYWSCLDSHAKEVCGADGKSDGTKVIALGTVTCKSSDECTACVQKK